MNTINLKKYLLFITIPMLLMGCKPDDHSYELGVIAAFSEMVGAGVKQLALSSPMPPGEMDAFFADAEKVASKYNVSVYREPDLIVTDLFPSDVATGKEVLLLYTGNTLEVYRSLKADRETLEKSGRYEGEARTAIARRFGRMLSYTPRNINRLLAQNTEFRTLQDFGIRANNLFLYYNDLEKAGEFYSKTLGMEIVADYGMALILRMTADSYLILVDATKGMHTAEEPKTVALALLTDQLEAWWNYLKSKDVAIKYDYRSKAGSAHDGFVVVDPEGYLLEFEAFNQHSENEAFIPILAENKAKTVVSGHQKTTPEGLGFHSTIIWLYYNDVLAMQHFYEEVLGLEMVADQGWTKIYQVSETGFMAIVDGKRGMHSATEKKAVNVGFIVDELEPWFDYVKQHRPIPLRNDTLGIGPENRYKAFVGFDPGGYYLEFDRFYKHEDNELLLEYLNDEGSD